MADDEEGFVRRWSRRKSEARAPAAPVEPAPSPAPAAAATSPATSPVPAEGGPEEVIEAVDPAALPAIESLSYDSDFTVFLRPGVPAELRRRALQQLWRSDPVLANLDGLVEYGEDYSRIGTVEEVVRTAYQVGRGMLDRIEAAVAKSPEEPRAVEPGADQPAAIEAEDDEDGRAPEVDDLPSGRPNDRRKQ
jgi:Protein of unknown function (DUF3306)